MSPQAGLQSRQVSPPSNTRECGIGCRAVTRQGWFHLNKTAEFRQKPLCGFLLYNPRMRVRSSIHRQSGPSLLHSRATPHLPSQRAFRHQDQTFNRFLRRMTRTNTRSSSARSVPRVTAATVARPAINPNTLSSPSALSIEYLTRRSAFAAKPA